MPTTIANIGLPMLIVYWPALLIGILPIVWIETAWISKCTRLGWKKIVVTVLSANLLTSVLGVPLTWVLLAGLQMITGGGSFFGFFPLEVTWQAPWLMPDDENLFWKIPIAACVLSVPFWASSAWIESAFIRWVLRGYSLSGLNTIVWMANTLSYALLTLFWVCVLAWNLLNQWT